MPHPIAAPPTLRTCLGSVGLAAACLVAEARTLAQAVSEWVAPLGGAYSDPANWSPVPPGEADVGLFALDADYAVGVEVAALLGRLIVRDGAVTFDLSDLLQATSATAQAPSIVVGDLPGAAPTLFLQHGPLVGQFMEVGSPPGAGGTVAISADAALSLAKILLVGPRGTGAVLTEGGLEAQRILLGSLASGQGEVVASGPQAQLVVEQLVTIGQKGSGSMHLGGGAALVAYDAIIALDVFSTGSMLVEGPGTVASFASTIDVGRNGTGTLAIKDGATVVCGADCYLGTIPQWIPFSFPPGGAGTLMVEGVGSTLHVGTDLLVPLGGTALVEIGAGGGISVAGALRFNKPYAAQLSFSFDASANASDPPVISVTGNVTSGLSQPVQTTVTLAPGFRPMFGDVFSLIGASSIASTFQISAPELASPLHWSIGIEAVDGGQILRMRVASTWDLDGNGVIDGADLGLLLGAWGADGPGDLDGSGSVDGADLGLLLGAWTS